MSPSISSWVRLPLDFFVDIGGGGGGGGGDIFCTIVIFCTTVLKRTCVAKFEVERSDDVDADFELLLLLSDNVDAERLHTTRCCNSPIGRLFALEVIVFADSFTVDPILTAVFGTTIGFAPVLAIIPGVVIVGALPVNDAARIF